jgi:ABC-2 type transport system permease protein
MFELLRAFVKKELIQALRDPRMKILLFIMPMIQLTLFGLALSTDVKNIKLYAKPMASDPLLREIKRDAMASTWFKPAVDAETMAGEDIEKFKGGQVDVELYAPEGGLTRAFELNRGELEAVIDGSDLIRGRSIQSYLTNIISEAVGQRLEKPNSFDFSQSVQSKRASTQANPINFRTRILYNPELMTSFNLVPGVLCMLVCIITIMLTSMSIAKEKEIGTFETLISAPVSVAEILLGKTIPYLIIGCINLPLVFFVAVAGFDVPMRGSYIWLALATAFFLVTTVSIGTMLSTVARNQQQAMMGGFIFILPAILLSGIMFPIENMPIPLKIVAAFNPLMYFATLLRNIMLKGGDYWILFTHISALFLIAVVSVATAFKRFRLHLG